MPVIHTTTKKAKPVLPPVHVPPVLTSFHFATQKHHRPGDYLGCTVDRLINCD